MNAFNKEKVYEQLRQYHTDKFPDKIANPEADDLKDKFAVMEDKVITMIVRFVNDKASFTDLANEVENFKSRLNPVSTSDVNESIKNFIILKIGNLLRIMLLARDFEPIIEEPVGR